MGKWGGHGRERVGRVEDGGALKKLRVLCQGSHSYPPETRENMRKP